LPYRIAPLETDAGARSTSAKRYQRDRPDVTRIGRNWGVWKAGIVKPPTYDTFRQSTRMCSMEADVEWAPRTGFDDEPLLNILR